MSIDAPMDHRATIAIDAPIERVWSTHVDVENWPAWHPDITEVSIDEPLEVGASFDWRSGRASIRSTITTIDAPAVLTWTGSAFGVTVTHQWRFATDGASTTVETHETVDGWLVRIFRRTFERNLARRLDTWLVALKQHVESG